MSLPLYTSTLLTVGTVYSREDLQNIFLINDATINNGIYQPKNSKSVWLFITENKTTDRQQYVDSLRGDVLLMDGQQSGRTDGKLINHSQNGVELLVFHRKKKDEYPKYGFKYEGEFVYKSHQGHKPAAFTLYRKYSNESLLNIQTVLDKSNEFNPTDIEEGKQRVLTSIVLRRGQSDFRSKLLSAYSNHCAVTGCDFTPVLEAAHIISYNGLKTNHVQNGLLLRADIHTLFDLQLLSVNPENYVIWTAPELQNTDYSQYNHKALILPKDVGLSYKTISWVRNRIKVGNLSAKVSN